MAMKKIFRSGVPMMIGNTDKDQQLFLPGFRYRLGSIIYTVKADVTQEASSPMREVLLSDGSTQIIPVETLIRDMREIQNSRSKTAGEILEPDQRLMPKTAVPPVKKMTKTAKKKVSKKKIHKKNRDSFSGKESSGK